MDLVVRPLQNLLDKPYEICDMAHDTKGMLRILTAFGAGVHAVFVEAFSVYQSVIQAGWYEALEHPQDDAPRRGCPVKGLIQTNNKTALTIKDKIA